MQAPRGLGRVVAVLAALGVALAGYLTYVHYANVTAPCAVVHGCEVVQKSDWSKLAGIPVAVLGLLGYVVILASTFVRGEIGLGAGALVALGGFGFSMYLTYREAVTLDAWCMYCVGSAILMTLLAITTVIRLWRAEPSLGHEPEPERHETHAQAAA